MNQTPDTNELPALHGNVGHVMRRIRACESEVPAQLVLEHALHAYAREAISADRERQAGEAVAWRELLHGSRGYVEHAAKQFYDGTDGESIRRAAKSLLANIDTALVSTPAPQVSQAERAVFLAEQVQALNKMWNESDLESSSIADQIHLCVCIATAMGAAPPAASKEQQAEAPEPVLWQERANYPEEEEGDGWTTWSNVDPGSVPFCKERAEKRPDRFELRALVLATPSPATKAEPVAPPDPMDWPLPCDVKVGYMTMCKGVSLRTLVARMKVLHETAFGPPPSPEEMADRRARFFSALQPGPVAPPVQERETMLCEVRDKAASLLRHYGGFSKTASKLRELIDETDREIDELRAAQPAQQPEASGAGEREADARMIADFPALSAFHTKHALGPMCEPSCLCCGQLPEEVAIKHMELPGIVICAKCRDAALASKPPAVEQKPVAWQGRTRSGVLGTFHRPWKEIEPERLEAWRKDVEQHPNDYQMRPVYTAPQPEQVAQDRLALSDDDLRDLWKGASRAQEPPLAYGRAVERAHSIRSARTRGDGERS